MDANQVEEASNSSFIIKRVMRNFKELGILIDEKGKVPKSADVPRIFIYDQKNEKARTLEEAGITGLNDKKFMEAMLTGHVFCYPTGKASPVQMQAEYYGRNTLSVDFGKPIDMNVEDPRNGPLPQAINDLRKVGYNQEQAERLAAGA